GTPANEQAVEWGLHKFQEAGVEVRKAPFTVPALWLPKTTNVQVTGATTFAPNAVAKYQSPPGTYTAPLLSVGEGTAATFAALGTKLNGKFIIVSSELCLDIPGLFAEYTMAAKVEQLALSYGVKGIVFMASRPKGLLYRFISSKVIDNKLPQLVMAREDAKRCMRMLESGAELQLSVSIDAQIGGAFTSHNVIAEIPGSEKPEEVVIIGAHLDSWALGTGANDNACNVSMMIDIARQMKRLQIQPKRTIRFALWNGEEQGYFGSWAYTRQQENQLDQHLMALSVDIGSGPISGFFTNGRPELMPVMTQLLEPVAALGTFTQLDIPIVGTDNFDFMLQGVANLVANHLSTNYGLNYHAASDTYDKVDLKSLKINSAIIAAITLGFANLPEEQIHWKRQNRSEIQQIFETHQLEFTMRMFNVWEAWVNGERGRQ
ncbi:MAG: M20/M25/M40 family metallo-hydrolase, partial [Bacteroidota bacterium]